MSWNDYYAQLCARNAAAVDRAQLAWENPPEETEFSDYDYEPDDWRDMMEEV